MRRLLCLLPLLAACGDTLPVQSFVEKLRVLGVRAEPPEVAPGEATFLDALVVQPPKARAETPKPISYLWLSCSVPSGVGSLTPCGAVDPTAIPPSCTDAPSAPLCLLGTDATATYTPDAASVGSEGTGQRLITLVASETANGATGCLLDTAANGGIPTDPDHCVLTLKRLVVSTSTAKNHNPTLTAFTLRLDQENAPPVTLLDGNATYALSPAKKKPKIILGATRADDASELKDGTHYEELTVAWYISAGKLAGSRSVFEDTKCQGETCNEMPPPTAVTADWTAPTSDELTGQAPADGETDLWAIIRDDRGGIGWLLGTAKPE